MPTDRPLSLTADALLIESALASMRDKHRAVLDLCAQLSRERDHAVNALREVRPDWVPPQA